MENFLKELKRRNVFRVGIAYLVLAWALLQVADLAMSLFGLPDWGTRLVFVLLALGLAPVLFMAWIFELTPAGLKTQAELDGDASLRSNTVRKLNIITGAAALLAIVLFFVVVEAPTAPPAAIPAAGGPTTGITTAIPGFSGRAAVAVLPFMNLSTDPDQQYFADGMTEDIIVGLQAFRSFPVIARTSTFRYRDQAKDVREIARELGVGYVVTGSVRKSGDRLRVSVQLISAGGRNLWAENYDRELESVLTIDDEITNQIVNAIEPELLSAETRRVEYVRTADLEAWDYYLRALSETTLLFGYTDLHGRKVTFERNQKARELALKATELDPGFAQAYTLLTHIEAEFSHSFRANVSAREAAAAIERSRKWGAMARRISPFDAAACSCLSWVLMEVGDIATALEIQRSAVEANPSNSNVHAVYAWALLFDGKPKKALQELALAKRLSPRDMGMSSYLLIEANIHLALGDLERSAQSALEATVLVPLNFDAQVLRILVLDELGRETEARALLKKLPTISPDFSIDSLYNSPALSRLGPKGSAVKKAWPSADYHELVRNRLAKFGWRG
ncbi:MAG: hypothetical protein V3R73_00020 [Sphingomonadales bacterium]